MVLFIFLGCLVKSCCAFVAKDGGERHYKAQKRCGVGVLLGSVFGVKGYILAIRLLKTAAVRVRL
jgi:hypothetical protein